MKSMRSVAIAVVCAALAVAVFSGCGQKPTVQREAADRMLKKARMEGASEKAGDLVIQAQKAMEVGKIAEDGYKYPDAREAYEQAYYLAKQAWQTSVGGPPDDCEGGCLLNPDCP